MLLLFWFLNFRDIVLIKSLETNKAFACWETKIARLEVKTKINMKNQEP